MGPVGFVARHDLRRRAGRLVVLALLVGVAGAVVLATVAGARRADSSLVRFRSSSRAADVEFAIAGPSNAQLARLRRTPGVAAVGVLRAFGLTVPRAPDFYNVGTREDDQYGVTVDRERLVAGRAPDPGAADEVTVGEGFAARLGLHVGDRFTARSYTPAQIAATLGGASDVGALAGPTLRLHVVGIVRRPLDLGDRASAGGLIVLTPAFAREYGQRIGVFGERLRVRTNHPGDVRAVLDAARGIFGNKLFLAQSLAIETQGAGDAIEVITVALWIGAAVAGLAALVAIGVALARDAAVAVADLGPLGELGCTRVQRTAALAPASALVAGSGALLAIVGAIALSPRFPLGVARRADPDVGVHADLAVLVLGAVVIVAVVVLVSFAAAYRAAGRRPADVRAGALGRPTLASRLPQHGSRPPVTNGIRMALEPGAGPTRVPVRSALVGAVFGVTGITAALVFAASLDQLAVSPARYGATFDFKAIDVTANTPCGAGVRGLDRVRGVATLTEVCTQSVDVDGRPTPGMAYRRVRGAPIGPAIVAGRTPVLPDEVALGAKTLRVLHRQVGDRVRVATRSGRAEYRIVGRAAFPTVGQAQPLADGIAFTGAGYARVFDQNIFLRVFVGRYARGADPATVVRRIGAVPDVAGIAPPSVPTEIGRLQQVDWLPIALAVLLGVLALAAVAHALVISTCRRHHDLALLKALGFTRRDVRATVAWQATTLAVIGLVFGVPLGLVLGQTVWRQVADGLGVTVETVVPVLTLLAVVLVTLVVVNAVAFAPARIASRRWPATALRAE